MKKTLIAMSLLLTATWAQATLSQTETFGSGGSYPLVDSFGNTASGAIPVGNPVGVAFGGDFSQTGFNSPVIGITVGLDISGGYNQGLYAYLVAPNGTVVVLLNRPGTSVNPFGNTGAGMSVTLQDGASNGSINNTTTYVSGTYSAVGTLSSFDSSTANGEWTLFFADLTRGGGQSTLLNWSLDLTVVPEPVLMALATFVAMLMALAGLKWAWKA